MPNNARCTIEVLGGSRGTAEMSRDQRRGQIAATAETRDSAQASTSCRLAAAIQSRASVAEVLQAVLSPSGMSKKAIFLPSAPTSRRATIQFPLPADDHRLS